MHGYPPGKWRNPVPLGLLVTKSRGARAHQEALVSGEEEAEVLWRLRIS